MGLVVESEIRQSYQFAVSVFIWNVAKKPLNFIQEFGICEIRDGKTVFF